MIYSIEQIRVMARQAVENGQPASACPFQLGTSHHDHWVTEFHRVQIEMRAEVEL